MEGIKLSLSFPCSVTKPSKKRSLDRLGPHDSVFLFLMALHLVLTGAKISVWLKKQGKVEGNVFLLLPPSPAYLLQLT